jgi:hypothetical protein
MPEDILLVLADRLKWENKFEPIAVEESSALKTGSSCVLFSPKVSNEESSFVTGGGQTPLSQTKKIA